MYKSLKKLIAASAVLVATIGAASAEDVIRFATEAAYPPFNERAADGSIVGWEIDLGMAMCARIERKCEFVAQDWDGMIPGLLSNRFDGIFASMTITEERRQRIDFTNKYYQSPARFVSKEGVQIDRTAPDLGGIRIGDDRRRHGVLCEEALSGRPGRHLPVVRGHVPGSSVRTRGRDPERVRAGRFRLAPGKPRCRLCLSRGARDRRGMLRRRHRHRSPQGGRRVAANC